MSGITLDNMIAEMLAFDLDKSGKILYSKTVVLNMLVKNQ